MYIGIGTVVLIVIIVFRPEGILPEKKYVPRTQ